MLHLHAERLAALADPGSAPTPAEAEHLAHCATCLDEQLAHAALVAGARAERDTIGVPLTRWDALSAALRDEGLITSGTTIRVAGDEVSRGTGSARRFRIAPRFLQAAAAVALLASGAVAGRMSAVDGPVPPAAKAPEVADARLASDALIPEYTSVADARAALERFEVAYQHAAAYLAEQDTSTRLNAPDDYRTRLVALERAGNTMREAMEEAPYDPVLTGYYLTTLGQREATLRQINVAVPAGARLNSF